MEITMMLVLGTGHITELTAEMLAEALKENTYLGISHYGKGEYGWFVNVPDAMYGLDTMLPPDLFQVLSFARARGCDWVMLDRDGDTIDELPSYEW